MLVVEVTYPGGRCYAASSHAPEEPEWPPHPSRIYSALVAAAGASGGVVDTAREALEWLERQGPPAIDAPPADVRPAPTSYVPPADHNTQKEVEHPMFRARKPREFPVAYPLGEPVVRYGWGEEPPEDMMRTLDSLCASVTHVGTSHSMAAVRAYRGELPRRSLEPGAEGDEYLRIVVPGRLQELEALHRQEHRAVRHPPSGLETLCGYRDCGPRAQAMPSPFNSVYILRIRNITHGLESAQALAGALREVVLGAMEGPIPSAVEGREDQCHVAWLPLADVGHCHAKGRILGIAVALPDGMDEDDRLVTLRALGTVQEWGLPLPDGRRVPLEPLDPERRPPRTLQASLWTRPGRDWVTVTPVVPDRLPKRRRLEAFAASVADSLVRAGYPEPEEVVTFRRPLWQGAPGIAEFPTKIPRFHAWIRFPESVEGPVIAGRQRYFGVGLFRPWEG